MLLRGGSRQVEKRAKPKVPDAEAAARHFLCLVAIAKKLLHLQSVFVPELPWINEQNHLKEFLVRHLKQLRYAVLGSTFFSAPRTPFSKSVAPQPSKPFGRSRSDGSTAAFHRPVRDPGARQLQRLGVRPATF